MKPRTHTPNPTGRPNELVEPVKVSVNLPTDILARIDEMVRECKPTKPRRVTRAEIIRGILKDRFLL